MLAILRRHLFSKDWIIPREVVTILRVFEPYRSTLFMLKLNSPSFVLVFTSLKFQMFLSIKLFSNYCRNSRAALMVEHASHVGKGVYFFQEPSLYSDWVLGQWSFIHLVSPLLIFKPILDEAISSVKFYIWLWLCEGSVSSSAKSRSSIALSIGSTVCHFFLRWSSWSYRFTKMNKNGDRRHHCLPFITSPVILW